MTTHYEAQKRSHSNESRLPDFRKRTSSIRTRVLHGVKSFLPDYVFLFLSHRRRVGRFPNLKRATTFNEIMLDRCLHPDPIWSTLADKLAVRGYVKRKVGEKHLVPLLAAPDAFTQQVFDALPPSFVMKANHGCGFVKVVRDKSTVTFEELRRLADEWLSTNFYLASRERHYRVIEPRIYFEQLLLDKNGVVPPDFKIHIFNRADGDPVVITGVITDRFGSPRHDFYDTQWNRMDIVVGDYPLSPVPSPRLPNWDEVVKVASTLVEELGYARVDLYVFDDQILFGELTFTPGAGVSPLSPERYDYEWGKLINEMPSSRTRPHTTAYASIDVGTSPSQIS
ncbi:ATP-grasp fold amidoligase family protein [Paraburkholderia sp. MPAMCS5]|uniref:ATP-grasp fold amidoligase family protein n=1 Tax=Paraburkholderia sp. MPAMCS5 TaxID=3112563 RepID=UPI002E18740C|nr:ATP-grasp fold amidoligase family protein [Paraburkholderia sp. MPAMCS5]